MKFDKSLDWLKESDEDEIFGDDLDDVKGDEEQINEVRYIDPDNLDRYNPDEIEEVTTASGEKRYKRKTGAQPSNQTVDKKEEPKDISQDKFNDMSNEVTKEQIDSLANNVATKAKKIKDSKSYKYNLDLVRAALDSSQQLFDNSSNINTKDLEDKLMDAFIKAKAITSKYDLQAGVLAGDIHNEVKKRVKGLVTANDIYDLQKQMANKLGENSWDDLMADAEASKVTFEKVPQDFENTWKTKLGSDNYYLWLNAYNQGRL